MYLVDIVEDIVIGYGYENMLEKLLETHMDVILL